MTASAIGSFGGENVPDSEGWVPLYLEGRTVIGKALIRDNTVEIIFNEQSGVNHLMVEGLIGLSTVSLRSEPEKFEEEITTKEKTDE